MREPGFLTIGPFDEADPRRGHESTLDIRALGERLGFDSAANRLPRTHEPQGPAPLDMAEHLGPALGRRPDAESQP